MSVEIQFRGPLAAKTGIASYHVTIIEGDSLRKTLQSLIESEDTVKEAWTDIERIDREALILRNEVDVGLIEGIDTILADGDKLVILPLVHGG